VNLYLVEIIGVPLPLISALFFGALGVVALRSFPYRFRVLRRPSACPCAFLFRIGRTVTSFALTYGFSVIGSVLLCVCPCFRSVFRSIQALFFVDFVAMSLPVLFAAYMHAVLAWVIEPIPTVLVFIEFFMRFVFTTLAAPLVS